MTTREKTFVALEPLRCRKRDTLKLEELPRLGSRHELKRELNKSRETLRWCIKI
jgi:hypothetical protein